MFSSIGAVASLFDISCLDKKPEFATVQTTAYNIWSKAPAKVTATSIGSRVLAPFLLGVRSCLPFGILASSNINQTVSLLRDLALRHGHLTLVGLHVHRQFCWQRYRLCHGCQGRRHPGSKHPHHQCGLACSQRCARILGLENFPYRYRRRPAA